MRKIATKKTSTKTKKKITKPKWEGKLTLWWVYYICRELWRWMKKTGKKAEIDKEDWPEWWMYQLSPPTLEKYMLNACPCCHYAKENFSKIYDPFPKCQKCPLIDLWGKNDTDPHYSEVLTAYENPTKSKEIG